MTANARIFMSTADWREYMAQARTLYSEEGNLGAYGALRERFDRLEGRRLPSIPVRDLQKTFALAIMLMADHYAAKQAAKEAPDKLSRMMMQGVVDNHVANREIIRPESAAVAIMEWLDMGEGDREHLVNQLLGIFVDLVKGN